ncbi:MAG: ABC transporter permease subunit [Candidatus Bathyarchaeia archaeon]
MLWLKQKSPFILVSLVLSVFMILFLLVPVIGSLTSSASGIPAALTDQRTLGAIWTSFYCAFIATLLMMVLGVPFAYLFTRTEFMGKKVLDSLIDIPILIPHNTAGIALFTILAPDYPIGAAFSSIGIGFIDTVWGIVAAMAFVSAPFMIRSAQEAFASVNPNMEKTGRSLGASRFQVFRHVTLPLASRGILTGCLLTWARAVSEFGAVAILAYFPKTAPVYLYDVFIVQGLNAALPINGVLILLAVAILVGFRVTVFKSRRPS